MSSAHAATTWDDLEPALLAIMLQSRLEVAHPGTAALNELLKLLKAQAIDKPRFLETENLCSLLESDESTASRDFIYAKHVMLNYMLKTLVAGNSDQALLVNKLNEFDGSGKTLLDRAIEQDRVACVALLLQRGSFVESPQSLTGRKTAWDTLSSCEKAHRSYSNLRQIRDLMDFQVFARAHGRADAHWVIGNSRTDSELIEASLLDVGQGKITSRVWSYNEDKPDGENSTWIHVPETNGLAILAILRSLKFVDDNPSDFRNNRIASEHVKCFYEQFRRSSTVPGDPLLNYREHMYWAGNGNYYHSRIRTTVIVYPWLATTSMEKQKSARSRYKTRIACLSSHGPECLVQADRTLDEAYYPGLNRSDLATRNESQVVSRQFQKRRLRDDLRDHQIPILMVPHFWIWRLGPVTLSATSMTRQGGNFKEAGDKEDSPSFDLWDSQFSDSHDHPLLQIGYLLVSRIESFGKQTTVKSESSPEEVTFVPALDQFEADVVSVLSETDSYVSDTKTTKPGKIMYHKERRMLSALADVRNELAMIEHIFDQQQEVLDGLMNNIASARDEERKYRNLDTREALAERLDTGDYLFDERVELMQKLDEMEPSEFSEKQVARVKVGYSLLAKYRARIKKIDGDAQRIEGTCKDMLELKRTYATIKDSHASLLLSTAVIGFTIITIIFAPLAFLTALFALKIDGFERLQSDATDDRYDSKKMIGVFVGSEALTFIITAALVVLALWAFKRWDKAEDDDDNETVQNPAPANSPNSGILVCIKEKLSRGTDVVKSQEADAHDATDRTTGKTAEAAANNAGSNADPSMATATAPTREAKDSTKSGGNTQATAPAGHETSGPVQWKKFDVEAQN